MKMHSEKIDKKELTSKKENFLKAESKDYAK